MGTYAYIARNPAGQRVTGTVAGVNEQAVLGDLAARSLSPVRIDPVQEKTQVIGGRISTRKLAGLYRQLSDLLRSGVPLLRALRLLGRSKSNPRLARVMNDIADAVADGERLADAMASKPRIFPEVHVALIRAGETGGFLEQVLTRLGDFLEHQADMKSKVVGNLIYPCVLLTVAVAVVVGALVFFVPKFETMFSRIELPWATQVLLGLSKALTQHGGWVALAVLVLAAVGVWLLKDKGFRRKWASWQLMLPGVGPFISSLSIARFTRILGTMLGNGIPMLTAMKISRDAAGHPVLAEAIDDAAEAVRSGESLAKPLEASGMISEDVVEMIAVGEAANNLPDVLVTIAETIEKRVDRMLGMLLRLMEPMLLMFLAGVVVFIFVALFMPMLRMSTAIGK